MDFTNIEALCESVEEYGSDINIFVLANGVLGVGEPSGEITVPRDEYAIIARQIATYPQKAERGHVFTANNYYLCTNIDTDGNFKIVAALPIEGNEDIINELRGKSRQTFVPVRASERLGRLADIIRRRGGRISGYNAFAEGQRRGNGGDVSLYMGQQADGEGGNGQLGEGR